MIHFALAVALLNLSAVAAPDLILSRAGELTIGASSASLAGGKARLTKVTPYFCDTGARVVRAGALTVAGRFFVAADSSRLRWSIATMSIASGTVLRGALGTSGSCLTSCSISREPRS